MHVYNLKKEFELNSKNSTNNNSNNVKNNKLNILRC